MQSLASTLLRVSLGIAIGFVTRPLIMGCFQSTPSPTHNAHSASKTGQAASHANHQQTPDKPIEQPPSPITSSVTALPADPDADPSGQVLSVPRAAVTVGDRERAELKVKNLRDKLQSSIARSEDILHDEAVMAIRLRREGRDATARILLQRRVLLKAKIGRAEVMLNGVMDMIEGLEQAQDNKRLVEALERGTYAINEISKDVSVERMEDALADSRQAIEYVERVNEVVNVEAGEMTDADFETLMSEIEHEFSDDVDDDARRVDEPAIPEVPAEMPEPPQLHADPQPPPISNSAMPAP